MANNDSTIVTNLEATPSVMADASQLYGKQRTLVESFEVAAADSDGDTYTLFPVSLDARVDDLLIFNDAITGGTDYDIGFYKITDNDLGAAIDADKLMDGQTMASARSVFTSVLGLGTSAMDLGTEVGEKIWELCGYASIDAAREANPTNQVYVVITANTVGSATASLTVKLVLTVE